MPVVETVGLTKRFDETEALRGVDLAIPEATVLGVLGPNGAGKTTAVRILTTLLLPDSGVAMVDGIDVVADPRRVRARIGLTGQYAAVDARMTGRENIEYVGRLYHLGTRAARQRATELLTRFDLTDAADRVAKGYSGGMRRRLDIAMSLVARPSVLFLDEPTTGLDPRSRLAMWDLIAELVRDGTTTLLTTQYLEEADLLADRIAVIDHGSVIAEGTPDELKQRMGGDRIEVEVADLADVPSAIEALWPLCADGCKVRHHEQTVTLPVAEGARLVPEVVRAMDAAGVVITDVGMRRPTLDDVFLNLTGHRAEDAPAAADADGETADEVVEEVRR
jgi:ABC-2 type transport system ATP-binding protein